MSNQIFELYFSRDNLKLAYYRIVCWPERLVKDRFGIQAFGSNLDTNLANLSERIITGKYSPQLAFKYYEPKSSGTQRTKTLLMIEDALVYQAIANVIASKNYDILTEHNDFVFGSVLMPDTHKFIELFKDESPNYFFFKFWKSLFLKFKESVIKAIEKDETTYKFETDITGFFDSIPHYNLLLTLSNQFNVEDEILDLLSVCLNAWSGTKESSTPGVGIPQGPQPSYFLANLLLYPLDKQLISEAFKYYRYMDDIKIYGYSEHELRNVLVSIDNYLKGHGLSINSKKTEISKIDIRLEDETVKELRRLEILGTDYSGEEINPNDRVSNGIEQNIFRTILGLSDQTSERDGENGTQNLPGNITDKEEIIAFWKCEKEEVERTLPTLFNAETLELLNSDNIDDIDFIRLSAKYGNALRGLSEYTQVNGSLEILPYWIFALKKFFWRASNFVLTLQHYKHNEELKNELISIYLNEKNYECYRYHIVTCLTYNFNYTDKELREVFKYLKTEKSDLVKYALYSLIIKHSDDLQMQSTLKVQLSRETSKYLKIITIDFIKQTANQINNMNELVKSMGL